MSESTKIELNVIQLLVCSDDEDVIPLDAVDLDLARLAKESCEEERPDTTWRIIAEIDINKS